MNFNEIFSAYKNLSDMEKQQAIIDFLKQNVVTLQYLNKNINNSLPIDDLNQISNVEASEYLDVIYQLLHLMTEQVEMYVEKISQIQ